MAFLQKEKLFTLRWFKEYSFITIGAFILAVGFVFFITPHKIVPGGVYGIAIVVHYMTEGVFSFWPDGIPIGLFGLVLNIPLTIAGIKILGPRFGVKTVVGFVLSSVFMDLITKNPMPNSRFSYQGCLLTDSNHFFFSLQSGGRSEPRRRGQTNKQTDRHMNFGT